MRKMPKTVSGQETALKMVVVLLLLILFSLNRLQVPQVLTDSICCRFYLEQCLAHGKYLINT